MILVLEVPGWEAGVKHGGRVNTGVSPSYVSQPQYADLPYTPAASTTGHQPFSDAAKYSF